MHTRLLLATTVAALLLGACSVPQRDGPPAPIVDASQAPVSESPAEQPAAPEPTQVYAYTPPESIPDTQPDMADAGDAPSTTVQGAATAAGSAAATTTARTNAAAEPRTVMPAPTSEPAPPAAVAPPAPEVARATPAPGLTPPDLPPAVDSLARRAEQQRQTGDFSGAAATLERALRIQPKDAYLWNRLARVRLEQGLGSQAGNFAARSNALAGDQAQLKQNNWDIIATVRRQSGDINGAVEAERMARGG
ncbi:tetratricopeptide repeat protein [Thiohalocapsa marina]|uniref:Tetratricopeptide repeat protein n=1 Tax=Thiohalocapsa marina TaxID=424902 RepID=A0A5M8FIE3_9GAMM|nr:tetratricopeptide repeat protein [Thiohalocapsa marina]KAA6184688.1 tetratricopeptide repeat protein [Thiohalocapsa marina]